MVNKKGHLWTGFIPVRFEMIKACKFREVAFLKPVNIRALRLWRIDQLNDYFKLANFYEKRPNIYISVATLKEIPMFTYHPAKRQKETSVWFRGDYFKNVTAYDLFIDCDKEEFESWDVINKEVKSFKNYLEEYKVPYQLIFSGNKGFQIIIPYEFLPDNLTFEVDEYGKGKAGSVYEFTKKWQEKGKEVFGMKCWDLSNSGIPNRLRKMPYSLVGDNVAFPLSNIDFDNWRLEDMHYEKIMKK